ncbi:MAG: cytochrome b N-terminal domain-containing protein [Ilumatobacter sp.]|uniref:cytochrome b N-terminal domain-containing protein n=1 Tax=Ilumatobacter sp. TaxID=1967498 RepID=UPI0026136B12|nr:cytochrome b N-terminal domain-containing protein [Ilumatobacter sp.]MDJ0767572.1 cytochrome b N-terminal domain-containing protein [Ilumatobacter sp.]
MSRLDPKLVPALERATYAAEAPLRKVVRSHRLNPLPHAGTISVFLFGVVVVSGVYITLFFQFGFEASHRSVRAMDDHVIQSVVRTVHRYSSAAMVLTTLVHAWRTFVAGRFRGPRRWRWTTGVASLLVVWLAGVTGYWLVWDRRAQALNEATDELFGGLGVVSSFMVRNVYGPDAGSGWGVLFVIWLAHLVLTVIIGYFLWRHLRRSRLRILPPRFWMALMLGALVLVSVLFPADLLERADLSQTVGDLPLDPFVLFLLPPLLGNWAWLAAIVGTAAIIAALVAPHVRPAAPPVVEIDEDACTGCDLCVVDCPYVALSLADRSTADPDGGTQARRPVAVVDADACVGCGICIGSCSFGAMTLPGFQAPERIDPEGRQVAIVCARHHPSDVDGDGGETVLVEVPCAGMVHANAVGSLMRSGAAGVQVVGCPPGDCAFGLGNTLLDERLSGARSPHVPLRFEGIADEDWVAPGELVDALAAPNAHPAADTERPEGNRRLIGAGAVVLASMAAVAVATQAPYRGSRESGVVAVVDHTPGFQLEGQPTVTGRRGDAVDVVVRADGVEQARRAVPVSGETAIGVVNVDLVPGASQVEVVLVEGADETTLFAGEVELADGERFVVQAVDVPPPPGIAEGRDVFADRSLGACDVCHSVDVGDDGVGPSLAGVATRAESRVEGLDAEAYLRQSVIDPDAYIADGYRAGQMLPIYEERLSPDQLDALVEYLLTLDEAVLP